MEKVDYRKINLQQFAEPKQEEKKEAEKEWTQDEAKGLFTKLEKLANKLLEEEIPPGPETKIPVPPEPEKKPEEPKKESKGFLSWLW